MRSINAYLSLERIKYIYIYIKYVSTTKKHPSCQYPRTPIDRSCFWLYILMKKRTLNSLVSNYCPITFRAVENGDITDLYIYIYIYILVYFMYQHIIINEILTHLHRCRSKTLLY